MKVYRHSDMYKGWFVGDFTPVALSSKAAEVAYRTFKKGDIEATHMHKVAQEVTCIVEGKVKMAGRLYQSGDVIVLEPGEKSDFEALSDGAVVVVKLPSVPGDKYPA